MRIALRVDAGGSYGLGHAQRMIALGMALQDQDASIKIQVLTQTPQCVLLRDFAIIGKWPLIPIPASIYDADWLVEYCAQEPLDIVCFDLPQRAWPDDLRLLRQHTHVVLIDQPWAHAETCDLLVLPDLHTDWQRYPHLFEYRNGRLLAGADYVLLRPEIVRKAGLPWEERQSCLVVAAGGVDADSLLWRLKELLEDFESLKDIHFLAPPSWHIPFRGVTLPAGRVFRPWEFDCIRQAQLLLTTFGVTVYEALYAGTPVCAVGRDAQQAACAKRLEVATEGVVVAGPHVHTGTVPAVMHDLLTAQLTPLALRNRHGHASGILDGKGAQRVADAMLQL